MFPPAEVHCRAWHPSSPSLRASSPPYAGSHQSTVMWSTHPPGEPASVTASTPADPMIDPYRLDTRSNHEQEESRPTARASCCRDMIFRAVEIYAVPIPSTGCLSYRWRSPYRDWPPASLSAARGPALRCIAPPYRTSPLRITSARDGKAAMGPPIGGQWPLVVHTVGE